MKKFSIITIFPESFDSYISASILGKAVKKKLIRVNLVNPRRFARDKHKMVDNSPYGGGPGMVLKIEPIWRAIQYAKRNVSGKEKKTRVVLFSTRGKQFTQTVARRFAKYDHLIFIAGRYEGVDERVADYVADEEISIGDFILSGGELPALVCLEAIIRHIPGVLGKGESLEEIKGSYPVYTRPPVFPMRSKTGKSIRAARVPKELISGDHKKIADWRIKHCDVGGDS